MNTLHKSLLIGMTVLGLGSAGFAAQAQTPAQDTAGRHGHAVTQEERAARHAEHRAKFAAHLAQRQAKLHEQLKLTAAQEPAWQAYVAATAPQPATARAERTSNAQLPAPERMEKRLEMAKQHLAKQEARLAALKTFYAVLTPEQQKTFDSATARQGRGHGHGRHHMPRHG